MSMVSAVGNNPNYSVKKNSNTGAKIGAGVGLAAGIARTFMKRDVINQLGDSLILRGYSKTVANSSKALGIALGVGLFVGAGALIGKGIQKLVNHFKGEKKPEFQLVRTVTKNGQEYVIEDGHPKTVYKKNPKTGELTQLGQVYDGSWGKEIDDDVLVDNVIKMRNGYQKKGNDAPNIPEGMKVPSYDHIFNK